MFTRQISAIAIFAVSAVFAFFLFSSCATIESMSTKPNSYAVVIGIENYRDIPKVEFAANDARVVYETLTRQMGYPVENVILLINDKATRTDIDKALGRWLQNQVDEKSRVFIFFAGHGAPNAKGESFIVPFDGDPSYIESTGYSLKLLKDNLSLLPTDNIVVAIDSCFSGLGGRSVIAKGARPLLLTESNPLKETLKAVVFSATQFNQISTSFPAMEHGLFTYFFLKGLHGEADANNDGTVDVTELFNYLKPKVSKQAKLQNVEQVPDLIASSVKTGMKLIEQVSTMPKITLGGGAKTEDKSKKLPPPGF